MIIDLINVEGPLAFEFSLAPDEIDLGGEYVRLKSDVAAKGELTQHLIQTEVRGRINAEIEIDCTRCLEPVERTLEIPFEVSYVAEDDFTEEREAELQHGDLETDVFNDDQLDLRDLVREQILLNLPAQVFCKEDCKGLCPKCGESRNLINCDCEENEIDPRWAALKNLK